MHGETHELVFRFEGRECWLRIEPHKANVILQGANRFPGEWLEWSAEEPKRAAFLRRLGTDVGFEIVDLVQRLRGATDRKSVAATNCISSPSG